MKINLKRFSEESTPSVPNGTNDAPGSNDYDSDEFDSRNLQIVNPMEELRMMMNLKFLPLRVWKML